MKKILNIAWKNILQEMRSPIALLFLFVMPIVFTAFLGAVFSGVGDGEESELLPLGWLNDGADLTLNNEFRQLVESSGVVEIINYDPGEENHMRQDVLANELAAGLRVPLDFSEQNLAAGQVVVDVYVDQSTISGQAVIYPIQSALLRLQSALQIGQIVVNTVEQVNPYPLAEAKRSAQDQAVVSASVAWQDPAITVVKQKAQVGAASTDVSELESAYDQSSPGMIVQFTINSVIGTAAILVLERQLRTMQRMLTTSTTKVQIVLGHALYIFLSAFVQQWVLVLAGQFLFGVNYLRDPLAVLLVISAFSLWVTSLGMLIGVVAKNQEQIILYSLIAMFLFTALAGAWFPLEGTSQIFYTIGHFTPGAWAMDGFQNIIVRNLGFQSVLMPAGMLVLFTLAFFGVSLLLFKFE